MKRATYLILSIFIFIQIGLSGSSGGDFFLQSDVFLNRYVKNERVDYQMIKQNPSLLHRLVESIENFDLSELPAGDAQKAFWINAYNILVIKGIVEKYPVKSPLDIDGFFKKIKHTAATKQLTLDEIENEIIRPIFKDARIHFALVCAARGCPPIINGAYKPESLHEQLDQKATKILNSDTFIRVDREKKEVSVSQIFNWFQVDFELSGKNIIQFINNFRNQKIPADFTITYYPYNWNLNDTELGS